MVALDMTLNYLRRANDMNYKTGPTGGKEKLPAICYIYEVLATTLNYPHAHVSLSWWSLARPLTTQEHKYFVKRGNHDKKKKEFSSMVQIFKRPTTHTYIWQMYKNN